MSPADIINSILVVITFITLIYTILVNRKVNRLNFRPYVDINFTYFPSGTSFNVHLVIFKSPALIQELVVRAVVVDNNGTEKVLLKKEWKNLIRMPSDGDALPFEFANFTNDEIARGFHLKLTATLTYGLIGDQTRYDLSKVWILKGSNWSLEEIRAT